MAYGARLESVLGASPRGFESPILRKQVATVCQKWQVVNVFRAIILEPLDLFARLDLLEFKAFSRVAKRNFNRLKRAPSV